MTDKQKIRAKIESSMKACEEAFNICPSTAFGSRIDSYKALLSFIDSLPEEPVSEGIENELERFAYSLPHSADGFWPKDIDCKSVEARTKYGVHHAWSYEQVKKIARHFADWKESQLMKDALNCSIIMHHNDCFANYSISAYVPPLHPASTYISNGDKVKIIIIREEGK